MSMLAPAMLIVIEELHRNATDYVLLVDITDGADVSRAGPIVHYNSETERLAMRPEVQRAR